MLKVEAYEFRSGGNGERGDGMKYVEYVNIDGIMGKCPVKLQEK